MRRDRRLHCEVWKEDNWWIAQCLEVAIVAQGATLVEAKKNLTQSLLAYFEESKRLERSGQKVSPIPRVPWYYLRLARWHFYWLLAEVFERLAARKEYGSKAFALEPSLVHA